MFCNNKVGCNQFFNLNSLREVGDHILPMLNKTTLGTLIFQNICQFIKNVYLNLLSFSCTYSTAFFITLFKNFFNI